MVLKAGDGMGCLTSHCSNNTSVWQCHLQWAKSLSRRLLTIIRPNLISGKGSRGWSNGGLSYPHPSPIPPVLHKTFFNRAYITTMCHIIPTCYEGWLLGRLFMTPKHSNCYEAITAPWYVILPLGSPCCTRTGSWYSLTLAKFFWMTSSMMLTNLELIWLQCLEKS